MEKGLLSAEGRIRRTAYWTRWLIAFAINIGANIVSAVEPSLGIIGIIASILVAIFMIIQGIKRMHDVDKSGWYILIPIYNLVLALTDGTPGPNSYGDDPKGRGKVEPVGQPQI